MKLYFNVSHIISYHIVLYRAIHFKRMSLQRDGPSLLDGLSKWPGPERPKPPGPFADRPHVGPAPGIPGQTAPGLKGPSSSQPTGLLFLP